MKKNLSFAVSTLLGTGYFPKAPGTAGSLVSLIPIFFVCFYLGQTGLIFLIFAAFAAGMIAVRETLKYTRHDPGFIVVDELVGQAITFIPVAEILHNNINDWWIYIAGFVFFRLFDVWKPFPIKYVDKKVISAFGVMLDDIIAGIYTSSMLYAITYIYVIRFKELNELMKLGN